MSIALPTPPAVPNCPSVQALFDAKKEVENHSMRIGNQHSVVLPRIFATAQEAKVYIEERMGGPIADPKTSCRADSSLRIVSETKTKREALDKAYQNLQMLIDQDALKHCEQRVVETLGKLADTIQDRSLASLDPLADLISSLLNTRGMEYKFTELDFLVTKINELSREMVIKYQMTNQKVTLSKWIDIMLSSAEKNPAHRDSLIQTFKTAVKTLQSSSEPKLSQEQIARLRKMARNSADLPASEELLKVTGSKIWFFGLVSNYLECIPDDLKLIERSISDIADTVYQSSTLTTLACAPLAALTLLFPDRIQKGAIILGALYTVYKTKRFILG